MPTQRPFLSTTGTPGSSFSWSARTTSSTFVPSVTVTGSRSITSCTRVAIAATLSGQSGRKALDHVAGHHVVHAVTVGGGATRAHVRERPRGARLERAEALREERADQARQHVAGARGGQRGRAAGV